MPWRVDAIGYVRGGRAGTADDAWGDVACRIELDPARFGADALLGLEAFSHAEVIFLFDRLDEVSVTFGARHPRGRTDWPKVGIFAQRGSGRPNRLGVCTCSVEKVDGLAVEVRGLDAADGTPVIDIKPVMTGFLPRGEVREPTWAREIMSRYW